MINASSYIPFYVQMRDSIKEKIEAKAWQAGDRLPSEAELCQEYQVSRTVVRQALLELELQGYILRRKGRGTFVAEVKINENLAQKLTGFYHDMIDQGLTPSTRVLHNKLIAAEGKPARQLNVDIGTTIIEIRRLRLVEGEPIAIVTSYLPKEYAEKLEKIDLTNRSLYEFLEKEFKLTILQAHRAIEAVSATEADAKLLKIKPGDPVVKLESTSYLDDGKPIEYFEAFHRGDRTRFEIQLIRMRDQWRAFE
jgi:GntR family transcriptional regulator